MKSKRAKVQRILFITIGLVLAFAMTDFFFQVISTQETGNEEIYLTDNWNITINDKTYEDVSLETLFFDTTNKGDQVSMTTILPKTDVECPMLRFLSCHSTLDVRVDGEQIYNFGQKRNRDGLLVGYGYHYIGLQGYEPGQTLTIQMDITENDAFTSFDIPVIFDAKDMGAVTLYRTKAPLFIGIFLVVFGISMTFITVIMSGINRRFRSLLCVSLYALCMGMWTLCNYHLLQLFTPVLPLCTIIEFASFYLAPIPMFLFFRPGIRENGTKIQKFIYRALLYMQIIFCVTIFAAHALGITHLTIGQKFNQVNSIAMLVFALYISLKNVRREGMDISNRILFAGIFVLTAFMGADMVRFNLQKYSSKFFQEDFNGISAIGVLIFVFMLLVTFCVSIMQNLYSEAKQKMLEKNVYIDVMTDVANRRKCEEEMHRLDEVKHKDIPYGIISFDLNELKSTNDNLGHDYGDALISGFAAVLKEVFDTVGVVGRMGGDEFIVIIKDIRKFSYEESLVNLQKVIDKKNETLDRFQISTSYGYATSKEFIDPGVADVYKLADNRMYYFKKNYKKKRKEMMEKQIQI